MKKLLFCLLLLASPLIAEDNAENGRLPDGRAYRTDDQGYQLVDYVAELELKVEELQNKIIAINNEQKFKAVDSEFSETNLMAEMRAKKEAEANCPSCDCPEAVPCPQPVALRCPAERDCPEASDCSCNDIEDHYKSLVEQAEKRLINLQETLAEKQNVISSYELAEDSSNSQEKTLREVREQVARLQKRLEEKDNEIEEYESLASNRGTELTKQNNQLKDASNKILRLEKEVERLELALNTQPKSGVESSSAIVSYSSGAEDKRSSAFEHLKNKLTGELASYRQLLNKRDALYKVYLTLPIKKTITINLSPTKTPDGFDSNKLQAALSSASRFSELGMIQKNLFILSRDVRKDLAILQRLTQR